MESFFIKIECSLYLSLVRVRAASGINSEWLRISDKPGEIANRLKSAQCYKTGSVRIATALLKAISKLWC